jgi:hypothetical protein
VIVRWNRTRWTRVASPNPGGGVFLNGVAAISAHNAWAVGSVVDNTTLILHWNGTTWK